MKLNLGHRLRKHPDDMRYEKIAEFCVGRVLDVGCGDGALGRHVNDYLGLDIEGHPGIRGNAKHLPLRDSSFDTVVLGELLEHVESPIKVIAESVRVTRKRVIITVPNPYAISTFLRFLKNGEVDETLEHICSFNQSNMKALCIRTGLEIQCTFSYPVRIPRMLHIPLKSKRWGMWSFYIIEKVSK